MVEIDSQSKAPSGFVSRQFRGLQLKLSLIEPESEPTSAEDWSSLISSLEPWGETPSEIEALTCITTELPEKLSPWLMGGAGGLAVSAVGSPESIVLSRRLAEGSPPSG